MRRGPCEKTDGPIFKRKGVACWPNVGPKSTAQGAERKPLGLTLAHCDRGSWHGCNCIWEVLVYEGHCKFIGGNCEATGSRDIKLPFPQSPNFA